MSNAVANTSNTGQQAVAKPSFGAELKTKITQFSAALPKHIPEERFARVVMTAVQLNPDLLNMNRQSLWNAAMKAASDGLLPDGREGALVPYKGQVQWLPMVGGLRKKVRNSKELSDWNAQVVYAKDEFEYELGDDPFIRHKPFMGGDRGEVIAAYSVATFRGTNDKSREVMSRADLDKVRAMSKASRPDSPWNTWFAEMCRKTVARRHSKVLPMSTDMDDLIRRDDELYDLKSASDKVLANSKLSLTGKLDMLAAMPDPDPLPMDDGEVVDGETGEVTKVATAHAKKATGTPAPVAADSNPIVDASATDQEQDENDPREATLAEARGRVMRGDRVTKILNELGDRRPLLTDDDVKALKAAEKLYADDKKQGG